MKLYELTEDFTKLMEAEDDEVCQELAFIVAGEIEQKAENICKMLAVLDTTAEQFKAEEQRIAAARKAMENKSAKIRTYMRDALLSAGIDKVTAGTFKVSIAMSQGTLNVDDIDQVPAEFITVVPASKQADKAAIKAAIKTGRQIPGVTLEVGYTMRIK